MKSLVRHAAASDWQLAPVFRLRAKLLESDHHAVSAERQL